MLVSYNEKMSCLIESIRRNASIVCWSQNVAGLRSVEVLGGCDRAVQLTVVQSVLKLTWIQHIMHSVCKQTLNRLSRRGHFC